VIYAREHFFDAIRLIRTYALETLKRPFAAGRTLALCDTNAAPCPGSGKVVREVKRRSHPLGIHTTTTVNAP